MSYADLKPVIFDDSVNMYATPHQVMDQLHHQHPHQHYTYMQSPSQEAALSEYFIPYSQNIGPYYHHQNQAPQQIPSQHIVTPFQRRNQQTSSFGTPNLVQQNLNIQQTPRPVSNGNSSDGSEELSEEVKNHWLPMTWIERSSDDDSTFNFVCLWNECVDVRGSKQEFTDHMHGHIDMLAAHRAQNDNGPCTCLVRGCNKELLGIQELRRHMTMHIFQADCQQKGSEALIEKPEFTGIECCGFQISTTVHYEGEVLICQWEECGIPFTSLTDLFDHAGQHIDLMSDIDRLEKLTEAGDRKNVFPCRWTGCTAFSDSKANLRRHLRHHSGEKVIACPFCAKFFSRKDKLFDHCIRRTLLTNEVEEPYLCKLCHKTFGTEKALCMHVTRHLVAHTCPLCALSVASRADLHRHLMSKHSSRTKEHKCEACSRCFFSESELTRHSVVHTDVMYNCRHCPEKFRWKKQLIKHMKEHDEFQNFNPSPYICHMCDKCYTTGFALGRHLTRQHNCSIPYGFSRFTYKKCADGLMRLQTKKMFRPEE